MFFDVLKQLYRKKMKAKIMDTCSASNVQLWNGKFVLPEKENTMNRYHILAYTSNRD